MKQHEKYERYERQILLKEFGVAAQEKLSQAKVLVIGAGGLGCPALQYLVAAGVGTIGIADDDAVALSNLHRQVLYTVDDIGLLKAEVAGKKLSRLNNEIRIEVYKERLINKNAISIIADYDIVIDGTDNFSSRYMLNDACVLLNKRLVYGAISRFEGQVAVFNGNAEGKRSINYRDLFPEPPKDDAILNCAEAGVLGVLPGIIGTMMANETIKLITGVGKPLINTLLTFNALDNSMFEFSLPLNENTQRSIPKDENDFLSLDYEWLCSSPINNDVEIDVAAFDRMMEENNTMIIDVREKDEQPFVDEFKHIQIPLQELTNKQSLITKDAVLVFCRSGNRSLQAAKMLKSMFDDKQIYSLKGGIEKWKEKHALAK